MVDLLNYIMKATPTPNVRTRNKKAVTGYRYGEGGVEGNTSVLVNTYFISMHTLSKKMHLKNVQIHSL